MPESELGTLLRGLQVTKDDLAAALGSPETHAELVEGILASQYGEADEPHQRGRRARSWTRRPLLLATALAAIVTVLLVATPGLLSGGKSATQPQSAQAAILHRIAAALAHRHGTIVVQIEKVHLIPGVLTQRNVTFTYESITETSGRGRDQRTLTSDSGRRPGFQVAGDGNLMEIYDPTRATIYTTTLRAWNAATLGRLPDGKPASSATVTYPSTAPAQLSVPEQELRQDLYRIAGNTRIGGRRVLKLVPIPAAGVGTLPIVYVSPRSYYPVREVMPAPRRYRVRIAEVTNWLSYRVLPADRQNQRLVSLAARHPHARLVRGARAYIDAQRRANKT